MGASGWQSALTFAAVSVGVWWLDRSGKRNAGVAGFVAVLDALFVASSLAGVGELERYGFLVLAPMLWATGRYGSDAASMSPLVAATVMVASNFYGGAGFTVPVMLHTAGILAIGLLTNQAKVVVKETQVPVEVTKEVRVEAPGDGRLRESFESLREHVIDLERGSRRDRLAMKLWQASNDPREPAMPALATKLSAETGAEGVVLMLLEPGGRRFVTAAHSGKVPEALKSGWLEHVSGLGDGQARHQLDKRLAQMRDADCLVCSGSVFAKSRGRVVGLVALFDKSMHSLDAAVHLVGDCAEALGGLLKQGQEREEGLRRLKEAELMYTVASVSLGSESRAGLVERVVRELGDAARLDHMAVYLLEGDAAVAVSQTGASHRVVEEMSFAYGTGLAGWRATGFPEVVALDALDDGRIERTTALKRRIGSLAVLPLEVGAEVVGFVTASTHRVAGIDDGKLSTLRAVVSELGQAMARLDGAEVATGVMTPKEFFGLVRSGGSGYLVYLDVLRRGELLEEFGRPAVEQALRRLTHRLRQRLPGGGGVCRRDEGDYVVFLPGMEEGAARSWANEAAAVAGSFPMTTPDGRVRMPVSLRAKVAAFSPQKNQVSSGEAA